MEKQQSGFTLIELVMVIVILGILSAVALPKFVDLFSDAEISAIKGVAGGLASAAAINYAGCATRGHAPLAGKCVAVTDCPDVGALMSPTMSLSTTLSNTNYYLATSTAGTANGAIVNCTLRKAVNGVATYSATYDVIVAGQ